MTTVAEPLVDGNEDEQDFNWCDDTNTVLRERRETACYLNSFGEIVVRQRASWDREEDPWIFFPCSDALAIVSAILRAAGLDDVEIAAEVDRAAPKDPTAAERQRRYRRRHRNGRNGATPDLPFTISPEMNGAPHGGSSCRAPSELVDHDDR
jgi:hypothetical protein